MTISSAYGAGIIAIRMRGGTGIVCALTVSATCAIALAGVPEPKRGGWSGRTTQGERMAFKVKKGTVRKARFTIRFRGCAVSARVLNGGRINGKGKFRVGGAPSTIRGRFVAKRRARGKVSHQFDGVSCPAVDGMRKKSVRFTARR